MLGFLVRLGINAVAIWIAVRMVGLEVAGVEGLLVTALALGLVNALIRPVVFWVTLPLQVLSLGCFTLVVNGLMLWLALWLASLAGGAVAPDFGMAFWGALVVSLVSWLLSLVVR